MVSLTIPNLRGVLLAGATLLAFGAPALSQDEPEEPKHPAPDQEKPDLTGVVGIGGGAGGRYGRRFGPNSLVLEEGGKGTQRALARALEWLARHQSEDGHWDADGFMKLDPDELEEVGETRLKQQVGFGDAHNDIGVTGLALLAFLAEGSSVRDGEYQDNVLRGIKWLRSQQDVETGLIGEKTSHVYLYNHAIATAALVENFYFVKSPLLKPGAQKAVDYILRSRNPYSAWRYDSPPVGDNDTSVTTWMVTALVLAEEAGLKTDRAALQGARGWYDEVTDPETGRVGYNARGSRSSRTVSMNEHFPPERGEGMTAAALWARLLMGQDGEDVPAMDKSIGLLMTKLPEWGDDRLGGDMYYWYWGTYAMFQIGGDHWKAWNAAMKRAVLAAQRDDGTFSGSWDPNSVWGYSGGRVYSTALMALCLQSYTRYARSS